ncbi:MAG: glycosyltransferase family 2 protein [Patescibacteria group bacterium]
MNTCDIIVPTYNGKEKLPYVIEALREQFIPHGWTVRLIVSDDGSRESIRDVVMKYSWGNPWSTPIILENSHTGRSHARNSAIDAATADIILFLADDIVLRPNALQQHLLFHVRHAEVSAAALGCVVWDPRIHPTPFMDWMMHGGQQNDYDAIAGVSTCNAEHYFYGSFISIKKSFLGNARFSEAFAQYGWEDLELGARLQAKGLVLHVLHSALALHRHIYTATEILHRQQIVGSAKYLVNTNISRRIVHRIYVALGLRALARYFMKTRGDTVNMPRFFALVTAGEFWYGVHHANKLLKRKSIKVAQ